MLRKKEVYTVCTPIPGFIPRQLALDILHSHSEVITLNPLVIDHRPISAPRDAVADEFYSTWYEITERVQVVPGMGKVGSSKITFNGCFHDMPWGLQTHTYAPFNIDIRIKYRVAGNQPGVEPPEAREIGLQSIGAPQSGLYLREDIEIKCNISLVSFVKAQLKAASKEMVSRIIRKAELLDSGVLQAMMSPDGKLRTVNPNDRSQVLHDNRPLSPNAPMRYSPSSPCPPVSYPNPSVSPGLSPTMSPAMSHGRSNTATSWQDYNQRNSYYTAYPNQQQQQQHCQQMTPPPIPPKEQVPSPQPMELPGDFQYHGPPQPSPSLHPGQMGFAPHHMPPPGYEGIQASPTTTDTYRTSTGSAYGNSAGQPSPGFFAQQSYAAELPSSNDNRQGWKQ